MCGKPYPFLLLFEASQKGHAIVVAAILTRASAADVDACDSKGVASLMLASMSGRLAVVEQLLAAGADVDAQEENGKSALMVTSCRRSSLPAPMWTRGGRTTGHL